MRVFRDGLPPLRALGPYGMKKAPFRWPEHRRGQAQYHLLGFENYVQEGFYQNPLIYRAIMYKVYAKWLAPLRAYGGDFDNPMPVKEDHPLAKLVARPNPYQSQMEFESLNIVYLNLSGNYYVWLIRPKAGGLPEEMYTLRPDRVFVVPDPGREKSLLGYWYVPENRAMADGLPIRYQDMVHVKYPNPGDALEGLGEGFAPLGAGARSADVDNSATDFLKDFFDRGLMPNVLLSFDVPVDDEEIGQIRDRWAEVYGGSEGWLKPGVLGEGGKVERLGFTFEELGFGVLDERNETRILTPFGVPAVLVGARVGLQNATYSNVAGLRRVFWEDVFVPELRLFEKDWQYYLRSDDGAWVAYDLSAVPALQEDTPALVTAAHQMWQMGVPANAAFRNVGLAVEPVPGGDTGYVPLALVPTVGLGSEESQPASPASGEEGAEAEEDERAEKFWAERALDVGGNGKQAARPKEARGWSPAQKRRIWKAVDCIATSWEGKFAGAVERRMRADQRELLALLHEEKSAAVERKATINWENVQYDWDDYFSQFADENWRSEFMPLIQGVVADQGEHWKTSLGMQFDVRNVPAEAWFQSYALEFAQPINATTTADMHALISQGMAEGWSIPQMEKQLGLTFDKYLDRDFRLEGRKLTDAEIDWFEDRMPRYRRENIARTESMGASNHGSHQLFKDWNVKRKEWLAVFDGRQRPSHEEAGLRYVEGGTEGPILLSEPFIVGGHRMMHPHDMSLGAPLEEVSSCRCVELPYLGD